MEAPATKNLGFGGVPASLAPSNRACKEKKILYDAPTLKETIVRKSIFLVAAATLAACTSDGTPNHITRPDLAVVAPPVDMAVTVPDLGRTSDAAAPSGCKMYNSWPNVQPEGAYDATNMLTFAVSLDGTTNALSIEDYVSQSDSHPKMVTYSSADTYGACEVCTLIAVCDSSGCTDKYFAQAGTVTVTQADRNAAAGSMVATASNLTLVEWDFSQSGDKPVPNGSCITIKSATFNVSWPAAGAGDMGGAPPPDLSQTPVDSGSGPPGDGGITGCHPVINEVQIAGASASDEWVEIYNPCGTDLTGWKLVYRSANNNKGSADTTLYTFTKNPGQYALVVGSGYQGTVTADATFSSGGLSGTGGAVGLRDGAGRLSDSVAYKTLNVANNFTEVAPAPNPPSGQSIARTPNGTDNNNNSMDFKIATTPTPKAAN
jgi:hypothetical protein